MRIRGCPAAVSENEPHDRALALQGWEAVGSRNPADEPDALASPKTCQHPAPGEIRRRFDLEASREAGRSDWRSARHRCGRVRRLAVLPRGVLHRPRGRERTSPMARDAPARRDSDRHALARTATAVPTTRPATSTMPSDESDPQTTMRVRKRNGASEPVDVNKIVRAVSRCCVGPDRRRRDARRDQDDQRPLRRRDHARARPALDPDRGGADRRGAGVRASSRRACSRRTSTRKCANQEIHSFSQSIARGAAARARSTSACASFVAGERPQAQRRDRRRARPRVRVLRPAHRLRPLPAASTRRRALVIETPQQFFLRVACALSRDASTRRSSSTGCSRRSSTCRARRRCSTPARAHEQLS